jgi:hypothetical protein
MTTNANTWFYRAPEQIPYYIAERVNTTFMDERIGGLWLDVDRAEPPFLMSGTYNAARVQMEWQPAKWLRLGTQPAEPGLARSVANILRRRPSLRYDTPEGETVWEWWLEGADQRWQELQGKPIYRNRERLDQEA